MLHSPSKYTSLERLEQIRKDNCVGATGKEYSEEELDQMIMEKKCREAEEYYYSMVAAEFDQAVADELEQENQDAEIVFMATPKLVVRVSKSNIVIGYRPAKIGKVLSDDACFIQLCPSRQEAFRSALEFLSNSENQVQSRVS